MEKSPEYFGSEEDTMKNSIFLRLHIASPPPPPPTHTHVHTFEEKYWITKCIEELYKLLNYFSHYTYHCVFFNDTIIIDRILDII